MRHRFCAVGLLALAACGGGAPAAPSAQSGPAPSQDAAGTVTVQGATLNFAAGVSASDRELITRAATAARSYFASRFGRAIAGEVTVNIGAGTGPMQAQGHTVTLSTGEQSWIRRGAAGRTSTVMHEFFHVLQGEGGWTFQPIQWLFEGAAEYAGYDGAIEMGLTTYQAVRACEIEIFFNGGGLATPPLHEISFLLSSTVGSRYAVAWLGIDLLVGGPAGIGSLRRMWENSGSMEERFERAFGRTPLAFSSEFQSHRSTFQAGSGNACNL